MACKNCGEPIVIAFTPSGYIHKENGLSYCDWEGPASKVAEQ